jgi:hypothetical protein
MMGRVTAFILVSCALLLHHRPAIAQSSSAFEHARVSFTSVHQYVATEAVPRQLTPPPNLVVSPMFRPLVESMLRDSPTFRRQCVRIAAEPGLTVHLSIGSAPMGSNIRAFTRMTRAGNRHLTAAVNIGFRENARELIAHEFEHIIEQLDGIDLAARAALEPTGVRSIGHAGNKFETTRARHTGLKVLAELSQ